MPQARTHEEAMTMTAVRRSSSVIPATLLALALLATATACSSGKAPAAGSGSPTAGGQGTTVTVTEKEYSLGLSQTQFTPGSYTFVADNAGTVAHALAISGPGVSLTQTPTISPGGKAQFTVTLQQGGYELWCPVDSHKALGMDTHIQVGAAGSASPTAGGAATTSSGTTGGGY
ncbi:copper-binding protein [Kitasatospora sp. RB6PN24]|uniref:copper-binding protein n=1 Tax=Kitasatospora humi TaxID=2893891 RepID=UPI001E5BE72B|nr:copper-binding protein [Kitasatospora humi]MCC9307812.1 copper-binding protein [Kitasatospora humi]